MTEVGAVLVGGGELHETFDSLVQVERPLSRGIQRFTGITQGMVDGAPPPEEVLAELADLLEGRVLIAHNARFDVRVLRQAFERAGLDWPSPPALCTVQLARRFAPAGPQAGARAAGRLARNRGRRGAPRAARRPHVRARVLRAVPEAVRQRGDGRRRARPAALAPPRPQDRAGRGASRATSAPTSPRCPTTRACTCSATSAGGRCTWASRCRCARARGRTSAPPPAGPSGPRSSTTGRPTRSSARSCSRTG